MVAEGQADHYVVVDGYKRIAALEKLGGEETRKGFFDIRPINKRPLSQRNNDSATALSPSFSSRSRGATDCCSRNCTAGQRAWIELTANLMQKTLNTSVKTFLGSHCANGHGGTAPAAQLS